MLRKKVCLLGGPGVGKTSLVRRFVESMFSDDYISSIGVKVDRKVVTTNDQDVTLLLWDIHGEHGALTVVPEYLRGSAAHLVVIDASRPDETVRVAQTILERSHTSIGRVPYVVAVNKSDLVVDWDPVDNALSVLANAAAVIRTSAKTGDYVDNTFARVAEASTS